MTEDEKYTDISEQLKRLPKLKASDGFMSKLESRIAEAESDQGIMDYLVGRIDIFAKHIWFLRATAKG